MSVPVNLDSLFAPCNDEQAVAVFDIDNTVADTRYRTMAVARAFDAAHHSTHFHELTLDGVGLDGASTAAALGLTAEVTRAFQEFWNGPEGFWCGSRFPSDPAIERTATIVRRAHAIGLRVVWLTGRIEALREPTRDWLAQQGLPRGTLVCKPDLSVRTAPFKIDVLREYQQQRTVRFFMTESRRDIAAVQYALPGLCCVLVDFPFQEAVAVRPDTLCLRLQP
jgi:hypothetical protein